MAKTPKQIEDEICEERLSKYTGVKVLGSGSYGTVYLVYSEEYKQNVVLKEVAWEDLKVPDGTSVEKIRNQISREVKCMKESEHDHIIGFVESFAGRAVQHKLFPNSANAGGSRLEFGTGLLEDEIKNAKQVLCIVMDYADGGDLEKEIKKAVAAKTPIAEERIWKWTVQITTALGYLHKNKVLHRDIKPANILLDANDDAIIADLGIAKQLAEEENMAKTSIGTFYYMCPELLDDKEYDGKCDMWALGCMIHELMMLARPFEGGFNPFILFDNVKYVRPPKVPSQKYSWGLRSLCKWLLQKDPKFRPDAYNFYSYCVRNLQNKAITGSDSIPFLRDESIPWKMEDLDDDEGKMDLYSEKYLGITPEERRIQREAEEAAAMAIGTAQTDMATQQALFDKNRLFKLGREISGGSTGSGSTSTGSPPADTSKPCVVVVGREHELEEAKHTAAAKTKKKAPAAMQAQKRTPQARTAASRANPNNALPRASDRMGAAGGAVKRPASAAGRPMKQINDDKETASKIRAHFHKVATEQSKKSIEGQIAEDLLRRLESGEIESYADICSFSLMAAKGAIRFDGTNPWMEYNKEPENAEEQAELMKYIMPGEERITFGALRVRRDLVEKFGMMPPAATLPPSAAN